MNVNGIFNPRTCRIFGWSTLFMAIVGVTLYVIAGMIDVPPESPLADPNYVLRELNDVTIPWDAELPPGTVAPICSTMGIPSSHLGWLLYWRSIFWRCCLVWRIRNRWFRA